MKGNETAEGTTEALPLTDVTNEANKSADGKDGKLRTPRAPKQRGPPEDGVPSKTKVMVANLPYDLSEEKVSLLSQNSGAAANFLHSLRSSSQLTSQPLRRSPSAPFLASWSRSFKPAMSHARVVVSVSSPLVPKSSSKRLSLR